MPAKIYKDIDEIVRRFAEQFGKETLGIDGFTPAMMAGWKLKDYLEVVGGELLGGRGFGQDTKLPPSNDRYVAREDNTGSGTGGHKVITLTPESATPVNDFASIISKSGVKSPAEFLTGLFKALGSKERNPDKSQYFGISRSGRLISLRLANHRASAKTYRGIDKAADGNVSLVIKMSEKPFRRDAGIKLTEYVYFGDRLDADREAAIAQALAAFIKGGALKLPIADQINESPGVGKTRYSIGGLFTGSAADYDKPSLHYVGTGEGSQVYGWGLYGSNVRGVAEKYMGSVSIGSEAEEWAWRLRRDWGKDEAISRLEKHLASNPNESASRREMFAKALRILKDGLLPSEHLYEQTFFTDRAPGDESHLLNWTRDVPDELLDKVIAELEKEGYIPYEVTRKYGPVESTTISINDADDYSTGVVFTRNALGQFLYEDLAKLLGSPKAASEFLVRAGIDGVKYPVDSYGKTVKDGDVAGWNYVSFRDDNIRVDHKWTDGQIRFSRALPGGKVVEDGEVENYRSPDGALHGTRYSKHLRKPISKGLDRILDRLAAGEILPESEIEKTEEWSKAIARKDKVETALLRKFGVKNTSEIKTPERKKIRAAIREAGLSRVVTRTVKIAGLHRPMETNESLKDGESYTVAQERKVFVITGLPAAGKSSTLANPISTEMRARICDSDAIKKVLPEFDEGYGGNAVHEESTKINQDIISSAAERGDNIVYPILGYKPEKLHDALDFFKKKGYTTYLLFNELPQAKAMSRLITRFLANGRFLPLSCVTKAGDKAGETFKEVKDYAEHYAHISNDVPFGEGPRGNSADEGIQREVPYIGEIFRRGHFGQRRDFEFPVAGGSGLRGMPEGVLREGGVVRYSRPVRVIKAPEGMGERDGSILEASRELSAREDPVAAEARQARKLSLSMSELEWLRKKLTGDLGDLAVGKKSSVRGKRLAIAADVFGLVDRTDAEALKRVVKFVEAAKARGDFQIRPDREGRGGKLTRVILAQLPVNCAPRQI